MKKLIFLPLAALVFISCTFNKNKLNFDLLYSTPNWTLQIEYENGFPYGSVSILNRTFKNQEQIKSAKITENYTYTNSTDISGSCYEEYTFNENGQTISWHTSTSNETDIYEYDEKHRLVSKKNSLNKSTWVYLSDTERQYFLNGELQHTEKIYFGKNGYTITMEHQNGETETIEFTYKFGKLANIKVHSNNFDYSTTRLFKLTYKNNLANSISLFYKLEDKNTKQNTKLQLKATYKYDANGNLIKIHIYGYELDFVTEDAVYEYSEYDSHGNWHKCNYFVESDGTSTITREIEYRD